MPMGLIRMWKKQDNSVMQQQPSTLWHHRDFLKVWAGQTISLCGSQVTILAFPLTAVLLLKASAEQMGFLQAAQTAPFLIVGLFVGVWVDRLRRRPVMIIVDVIRFLLLLLIPIAAFFHVLYIEEMYIIAFVVGILTVFFDVAYRSYLPSLIDRDQLIDGNSKLEFTSSVAQLIGPGLGGVLVQIFTAPLSLLVDAFSFLISALSLGIIRTVEPPITRSTEKRKMMAEIGEGLQMILRSPILAPLVWTSVNFTLFSYMSIAVFILYATDTLHISPAILGIIFAVGGAGAIPGVVVNKWITERLGIGASSILVLLVLGCSQLLVPLATGPQPLVIAFLAIAQIVAGLTFVIWNINQLSLRQALTPDILLGRVNASFRFLVWGAISVGSLIGGLLGTAFGLRTTLFIGTFGTIVAPIWLLLSPVRTLRTLPEAPEEVHTPKTE